MPSASYPGHHGPMCRIGNGVQSFARAGWGGGGGGNRMTNLQPIARALAPARLTPRLCSQPGAGFGQV